MRYVSGIILIFFFKQKTAYEMRISDWSSDVCSSDLPGLGGLDLRRIGAVPAQPGILHGILGIADRAEHAVSQAEQAPAVALEGFRLVVHGADRKGVV